MVKFFKIIGTLVLAVLVAALLIILLMWGSISYNSYDKKQKAIAYKKEVCDTITRIDENFSIALYGFQPKTVKTLDFYVIRQGKINLQKTIAVSAAMLNHEKDIPLTFPFLRNDTIAVAIGKSFYLLNGVGYQARYNYGMTGPVGSCFCESTGFEKLNGKPVETFRVVIEKEKGISSYKLP